MDKMNETTSRLRKTFRYPTDNDDEDDLPEALDEEEQEQLISTLHLKNTTQNNTYRLILLSLPTLSLIPYLPLLFHPPTTFLSLLSITSLFSTSYLLYSLPPEMTGFPILDNLNHSSSSPIPSYSKYKPSCSTGNDGPIKNYLPFLNLGLCTVLAILGTLVERKAKGEIWMGFGWLPGVVFAVVVASKWVMGSVDPEGELGGLKYGFKGA